MLKISIVNKTKDIKLENIFTRKLQKNINSFDNPKSIVLKTVNDTMHCWRYLKKLGRSTRVSNEYELTLSCLYCNEKFKKKQLIRQTNCQHYFHKKCLDKWILQYNQCTCPACDSNI